MRSLRRVLWILVIVVALSACGQGGYPDSVRFPGADASLFRGPDHCDWDGTWMVYLERDDLRSPTTWIGGTEVPGPFPALHMFVRDPGAVRNYSFEAPTDLHRDIPPDARLLGSSSGGYEL